jgi:hypothetical protein
MFNILGLSSLKFYSYFHKEIEVVKKKNLLGELKDLVTNIDNNGVVEGRVFRPTSDGSKVMTIVMGLFFAFFVFVVFGGLGFKYMIVNSPWWFIPMILFVLFILFYYSFFTYWIAPWWLKKNIDKYFIYVGKEGVVRQDNRRVTFIPWNIITGAFFAGSIRGAGAFLELEINNKTLWNPQLIRGDSMTNVFVDWVEYSRDDMRGIASTIEQYIK